MNGVEKLSIREKHEEELDPFLNDPELLMEEREERLNNDEIKGWEEGFEAGHDSTKDLLKVSEEEED